MGKSKKQQQTLPMVSICTPTFNRRPFIPMIIKCFEHQLYPKDRMEWIIIDDGTDKIGELVSHIPQVKYFKYEDKMTLGCKRNLLNEKATGDIIVYMDDDDYYPPERVQHAVETLQKNPKALCAGSSAMFIYFKHVNKMVQFGPYGPNHATAATFAFKRDLLKITRFDEKSSVAEEKKFLKDYTIPFVQLEPKKSILVFSHEQNSFDKRELLMQGPNPRMHDSTLVPADFVKEADILKFFMDDINNLASYEPGNPENKPDVIKQIAELKQNREVMIQEHMKKQAEHAEMMNKLQIASSLPAAQNKISEMSILIQQLTLENNQLTEKVTYLEDKMKQLISDRIKEKMQERRITLSQEAPTITSSL
jgi:glycosyltransferase involved in cell wall biosynthesis